MMMRKRARTCLGSATANVWKRELGELSTRNFAHRVAASEDLLLRLDVLRNLNRLGNSVNTLSFNATGHNRFIFDAKFVPLTEDRSIIICGADGQVRHAQISECGNVETKLLAKHEGRAHKLAIELGNPDIFYTCGEDGMVHHIDLRTGTSTGLFMCKPVQNRGDLSAVHLSAIAIDPRDHNSFAVGGSDQFARLFDIRRYKCDGSSIFGKPVDFFCPPHLVEDRHIGITGLAFSNQSELVVSHSEEFIYLFTRDIGLGPDPTASCTSYSSFDAGRTMPDNCSSSSPSHIFDSTKATPQAYKGHRNREIVKGVSFLGLSCEYIVSASDCGRIFIWRKKGGVLIRVMEADDHVINHIDSHPQATTLASSGMVNDIKVWIPKSSGRAVLPTNIQMQRPEPGVWTREMVSPKDIILQLASLKRQRQGRSPESHGEHSDLGWYLEQLLRAYAARCNGDGDANY